MTNHKPSQDLLPGASGMLPKRAAAATPEKIAITKTLVRKLACPLDREEVFYWDAEVTGLALRVYRTGRKAWVFQYRDKGKGTRRMKLGLAPAVEPAEARAAAKKILAGIAGGIDPATERRKARQAQTVGSVFEAYLIDVEQKRRPGTLDQTRRNLNKYAAKLHKLAVGDLDRAEVAKLHQKLGLEVGQVQANRVRASVSAAWAWALKTGLVPVEGGNPAAYVPKFEEAPRERVLTAAELKLIWQCTTGGSAFERIVRLLMLTAGRRQEIGGLRWDEISGDVATIPAARMKGGQTHEIALSALALAQLPEVNGSNCVFSESGDGFDSWSRAKAALDKRIAEAAGGAMPHWGLHDFRRTFATTAHDAALAEPHIIEAVLAHEGAKAGIAGVYNRAAYREQKRALLDGWAELVTKMVS